MEKDLVANIFGSNFAILHPLPSPFVWSVKSTFSIRRWTVLFAVNRRRVSRLCVFRCNSRYVLFVVWGMCNFFSFLIFWLIPFFFFFNSVNVWTVLSFYRFRTTRRRTLLKLTVTFEFGIFWGFVDFEKKWNWTKESQNIRPKHVTRGGELDRGRRILEPNLWTKRNWFLKRLRLILELE